MLTVQAVPSRRAGFTLVELLIAMGLMSLVGGAIVSLLLRQQRFYNSTTELIQTRQQVRQAAAMLPSDLRGISSAGGDISVMTDSALEFRSVFGSSVVCANIGGVLSTVPRVLATGATMTNWATIPVVGDSLAVYNNGPTLAVVDDGWSLYRITAKDSVTTNVANGCPTATGLTRAGDISAANPSYRLTLLTPAANTIAVGAAIRFFRRVRYRIYRDTDNQWYLGFFNCLVGRVPVCNTTQAIVGPFQPYANDATSGVQFAYYGVNGAVTADPLQVARISLVVRGQSTGLVSLSGTGGTVFHDSLRIEVGLRNRN